MRDGNNKSTREIVPILVLHAFVYEVVLDEWQNNNDVQ